MELRPGGLDPVGGAPQAPGDVPGGQVEEDGQVRDQGFGRPHRQFAHFVLPERASGPLVGDRGVDVPVRDYDVAAVEGRADDRGHVVGAVGGVQERFGSG